MKRVHTKAKKANRPFTGVGPVRYYNWHQKPLRDRRGIVEIDSLGNSRTIFEHVRVKKIRPTYKIVGK